MCQVSQVIMEDIHKDCLSENLKASMARVQNRRVHGMHAMHGTGSAVTEIRLFPNLFRMFLLVCLDSGVRRG